MGTEIALAPFSYLVPEDKRRAIPAMTERQIEKVRQLEAVVLGLPQTPIFTEHIVHGGMYARTVMIPAGTVITGALVKVPTVLIVNGSCTVFIGEEAIELSGHAVLPASAGRKQAFVAITDTWLTMMVATDAEDVDGAEHHFTDDVELLASHRDAELNRVILTGE